MPADDLVLNVRQIAGYPPQGIAPPASQLLIQLAGLGSAYGSISPAVLVGTALAGGGDMAIGGRLSLQSLIGGSAQFSNGDFNLLWARKANFTEFNAACGTVNGAPIATIADLNALQMGGLVSSFNARVGAVSLTLADVTGVGGAPIASPAFSGAPSAPTAAPGNSTGQLATTAFVMEALTSGVTGVVSFNMRTGIVALLPADVTGVGGALLASPTFTGVPAGPTAAPGTNTTQLATTAFVAAAIAAAGQSGVVTFNGRAGAVSLIANDISAASGALVASPAFTGTPTAPTPPVNDNTLRLATTAFVTSAVANVGLGYAPIASPAFTGTPTAPTPPVGDNSTRLATTAYVLSEITSIGSGVVTFNGRTGAVTLLLNDVTGAGGAPLASPALTGVPTAPTAAPGTATNQLATCAFVGAAIAAQALPYLPLAGGTLTGGLTGTNAIFSGGVTANGLTVNSSSGAAQLILNKAASGGQSVISGETNGNLRWQSAYGDSAAETGGNAGSNFSISRFTDAGASAGAALSINRASGAVNIPVQLTATTASISGSFSAGASTFTAQLSAAGSISTATTFVSATNGQFYWNAPLGAVVQNLNTNTYTQLDNGGNFAYVGGTGTATKTGGGAWAAASDARIKTVLSDYDIGLSCLLAMRPVRFVYRGNDTATRDGVSPHGFVAQQETRFVGFVAQELEEVCADMVTETPGFIDGQPVDDLRNVDVSNLVYILVNAVKTLAARLDALEAA